LAALATPSPSPSPLPSGSRLTIPGSRIPIRVAFASRAAFTAIIAAFTGIIELV
jgi:hypothetical protein